MTAGRQVYSAIAKIPHNFISIGNTKQILVSKYMISWSKYTFQAFYSLWIPLNALKLYILFHYVNGEGRPDDNILAKMYV